MAIILKNVLTISMCMYFFMNSQRSEMCFFFQQIEEKVWKQINGASETDSPCWPTDELCLFGYQLEFILS